MDGFHMFLYVFMLFYRTYHERCGFYRQRKGTPNSFLGSRHCFQKTEPADHKSVSRFELHLCLTGIWLLALDMHKLPVSCKYFHKGILYMIYVLYVYIVQQYRLTSPCLLSSTSCHLSISISFLVFIYIYNISYAVSYIYIYIYSNVMGGLLKADRCVNWLVQQWDHLRLMRARDP